MPRRPVKNPRNKTNTGHLWKPGVSGNPAGKPRGTKQITDEIREVFSMLLQSKLPELEEWLTRAAQRDPIKAADMLIRISERFVPMLSRTEITGAEGEAFAPITINLPNIPQINLGESSATSLLTSPAEEVKELREGTPAEIPLFLPELLDPQPFREGSPAEDQGDSREIPSDKL